MFEILFGKYRNIIVSIALFLLLDASVLMLNFYISFEISDDAAGVNVAGRQRMLSQRMVKSLFDIEYSIDDSYQRKRALAELDVTVKLFDSTLQAFEGGGLVKGAGGEDMQLEPAVTDASSKALQGAKKLWLPYKTHLDAVISAEDKFQISNYTAAAITYARVNNLMLLKLMNDLTIELESVASSKASRLRVIQTVGISLAIINFFIIMFHFLRQLKASDRRVELARKETTEILETVGEGLFLLDADLIIGSQYSSVLETMFVRSDISGLALERLLGSVVTDKDLQVAKRFIALLFKNSIKSNLIGDLNPLSKIEVNISTDEGRFISKYFNFNFERVYEDNNIVNVLVTVVDVTDTVLLARELALTKAQNERHIEALTSILHANPDMLTVFVKSVYDSAHRINVVLREPSKTGPSLRKKLNTIFVEVHRLKGESSALNLDSFAEITHEFELDILNVKDNIELTGDDFLPLVVCLEKLVKHTESIEMLMDKLSEFSANGSDSVPAVTGDDWSHLNDLMHSISERSGKKVALITSGFSEISLSTELRSLVNDIVIQGIRNAVIHGIETPEERVEMNKAEEGRIDLHLSQTPFGTIEISVKDDGYGIDLDRIREKASASGNWSESQLESWGSKHLMSLIFEPGFTTSQSHTIDAGSGVGMNVIRERVNSMRGKIRIHSRRGIGTKILVVLPYLAQAVELAEETVNAA